ncbi:MAG: RDD family protein [Nanoarchaeota archaeon]|nr:RDD family protein [Nanoarchaeota archaeon]
MSNSTVTEIKELLKIPDEKKIEYKEYGGFWRRALATIIDAIIISFAVTIPYGWVVSLAYYPLLIAFYGQTIGKKLLGLMVVNKDGKSPIGIFDAIVREWLGKFVLLIINLFFFIGFLLIGLDSKKEGIHDKIAKTRVVRV